jgi:hypothetical protein
MRIISLTALTGLLLLSSACRNEAGLNEQATANHNSALNQNAAASQASENRNKWADGANANLSPEQGYRSPEDFEGTAGITEKKKTGIRPALLAAVRTARHENFDRLVFEFSGPALPGYHLEYVDRPVRQCGSGEVVSVAGDGWLLVRFSPANAHTDAGEPTVKDRERRLDLPNLIELKSICDFEAEVSWVLGLSRPGRYRVLELSTPARLVVDVKH